MFLRDNRALANASSFWCCCGGPIAFDIEFSFDLRNTITYFSEFLLCLFSIVITTLVCVELILLIVYLSLLTKSSVSYSRRRNLILEAMAEPIDTKPFKDYAIPTEEEPNCSIVHPQIATNNFELKPSLTSMMQQN